MKQFIVLLFLTFTVHTIQAQTVNDPNAETRNISGSFHAIRVSDGIDLLLTQGSQAGVAVSASKPEYQAKIITVVENGVLKIYYDENWGGWNAKNRNLKAYVTCVNLDELKASSGSDVNISGTLRGTNFTLNVSSGSDFDGKLEVSSLVASSSSGSDITLSGSAKTAQINASSGSDFNGLSFSTENCDADASSGSDIEISVSNELKAEASSGASIRYKGNAVIREVSKSSGGSVKKV